MSAPKPWELAAGAADDAAIRAADLLARADDYIDGDASRRAVSVTGQAQAEATLALAGEVRALRLFLQTGVIGVTNVDTL